MLYLALSGPGDLVDYALALLNTAAGFLIAAVLVDAIILLIGARIAGVIDATPGQALGVAAFGKLAFFALSHLPLEVPFLGNLTAFGMASALSLFAITATFDVSFLRGLLVWVGYMAVFIGGMYLGLLSTGDTIFHFLPGA